MNKEKININSLIGSYILKYSAEIIRAKKKLHNSDLYEKGKITGYIMALDKVTNDLDDLRYEIAKQNSDE